MRFTEGILSQNAAVDLKDVKSISGILSEKGVEVLVSPSAAEDFLQAYNNLVVAAGGVRLTIINDAGKVIESPLSSLNFSDGIYFLAKQLLDQAGLTMYEIASFIIQNSTV